VFTARYGVNVCVILFNFSGFLNVKCSEYQVPLLLLFLFLRVRNLTP